MADINKGLINAEALQEIGQSGLIRFGGFVFEEFLRELQGPRGMSTYREMRDNDSTVGGALLAFDQLIRKVQWRVDPSGDTPEDARAADFLQSCISDMSATWTDTISEVLSMIPFGWAWHEIVYKQRLGQDPGEDPETKKPLPTSKHNDGLIGWRRLPIRAQETLWQWEFAEDGSIQAMIQRSPPNYATVRLPIEKALLFRHRAYKNNPEGRSALRNAYRGWYFKKKLEVIEAIGIERDLAGLPVAQVPPELLAANATPDQKALLAVFKKIVTNIRNDEQGGIVWPLAYDEKGNELFKLSLLSTGGRRQVDTDGIIDRYDTQIAQSMLADLILIGNSGKGSYALMETKLDLFTQAMEGWLDSITEVFNRYAVPRLFALNSFNLTNLPALAHGPVDSPDLKDLSDYITSLSGARMLNPNPADEGYLRQIAHLPAPLEDEASMAVGKAVNPMREMVNPMREMVEAVRELREAVKQMPDP